MDEVTSLQKYFKSAASKMHRKGFPLKLVVLHFSCAEGSAGNIDWLVASVVMQLGKSRVDSNWRGIREEGCLSLGVEVGEKSVVADGLRDSVE